MLNTILARKLLAKLKNTKENLLHSQYEQVLITNGTLYAVYPYLGIYEGIFMGSWFVFVEGKKEM